jgi:serine/threonine-protein kinase RsbW
MDDFQALTASPLPLWWSRPFRGEPFEVGRARSWIARLLPACEPLDDLLIFTSELAANAVTHTRSGKPGGWFAVEVTWSPRTARVVVGDQGSDEIPTSNPGPPDDDADLETGRGLLLVAAMSAAWGTAGDAEARWLWADVDWRSRGGPLPTAPADNSAQRELAAMRCAHPSTSAWYSTDTGQWHATLPGATSTGGTLTAPSPGALASMLAARTPAGLDLPRPRPSQLITAALSPEPPAMRLTPAQSALPRQRTGDLS